MQYSDNKALVSNEEKKMTNLLQKIKFPLMNIQ